MSTTSQAPMSVERLPGHPLRRRILAGLYKTPKPAGPALLTWALGEPLGNVSYHVRILHDAGALELIGTEQRRGAIAHLYTLTELGERLAVDAIRSGVASGRPALELLGLELDAAVAALDHALELDTRLEDDAAIGAARLEQARDLIASVRSELAR